MNDCSWRVFTVKYSIPLCSALIKHLLDHNRLWLYLVILTSSKSELVWTKMSQSKKIMFPPSLFSFYAVELFLITTQQSPLSYSWLGLVQWEASVLGGGDDPPMRAQWEQRSCCRGEPSLTPRQVVISHQLWATFQLMPQNWFKCFSICQINSFHSNSFMTSVQFAFTDGVLWGCHFSPWHISTLVFD